nr:glycine betaine/L-proline ABC transporter ATP-binding protein [Lapidilactobacillus luobeiensis]
MPIVTVKNLSKVFGKKTKAAMKMMAAGRSKTEILKKTGSTVGVYQADFSVEAGEIFVIMGLSGSGKSTLIRLLNRLIEPTSGHIYLEGVDINAMDKKQLRAVRRHKMDMVFQNFGLLPNRTVQQNVEFGLEIRGVIPAERAQAAQKALAEMSLTPFADQYPEQLSGGMQQRVGLARALANDPDILLMDEAFSALDPLIRREMQDELIDLQANLQKTIIFITHDLNEALRIGDRIAVMRDGQIQQIGTGEEILTHPANDYVRTFTQDVDYTKVLTARNIMIPAVTINLAIDGPKMALRRMRHEETSMLIAIDKQRRLQGVITADGALSALKNGQPLIDYLRQDIPKISSDTIANEIFNVIYAADTPVAVVDEQNKLLGVVIRGSVLEALADTETTAESPADPVAITSGSATVKTDAHDNTTATPEKGV